MLRLCYESRFEAGLSENNSKFKDIELHQHALSITQSALGANIKRSLFLGHTPVVTFHLSKRFLIIWNGYLALSEILGLATSIVSSSVYIELLSLSIKELGVLVTNIGELGYALCCNGY